METNESKPKRKTKVKKEKVPCAKCKKKAPVSLPALIDEQELMGAPSVDEVKLAYQLMGEKNITDQIYATINNVYKRIFLEDLPRNCSSCGNKHFNKFRNYIRETLKLQV